SSGRFLQKWSEVPKSRSYKRFTWHQYGMKKANPLYGFTHLAYGSALHTRPLLWFCWMPSAVTRAALDGGPSGAKIQIPEQVNNIKNGQ
ncbi:MAG: hypothetical protein II741_06130, partial [Lachnospiraceae bacterium]|nr:hypothetical protein [Lachnospiraceae bacterium]